MRFLIDGLDLDRRNEVSLLLDEVAYISAVFVIVGNISVYILIVHGIFPYFCPSIEMRIVDER